MPYFPSGTKSLLAKCLTKDVWEKCKDRRDKYGFSFKQAIFSGAKWTNSGVGIYAGSHDSYYAFAPLFDKVIEQYHGHKPNDKHISSMDYKLLKCPPFPPDEDKMINSTRIRVARNLAAYPLGTAVTRKERLEIEKLVVSALNEFDGELKGKYYSLAKMTEAEKKQLINDHFLFKGGDKYLESCGLERDWPEARGIFHNNNKTFLVWVNEEDQLRIISMQPGSNIHEVFKRLSVAAAKIEEKAKFANDEHLGYISNCPTNLGTGLRASVHINLPKLMKNPSLHQSIADKYHVQIRGIHGEHTETDDGVFDISNLRRLGRNEVQLVQDMYDGVKAMIKAEKSL
jgi:creatine kinase/arginine kinase